MSVSLSWGFGPIFVRVSYEFVFQAYRLCNCHIIHIFCMHIFHFVSFACCSSKFFTQPPALVCKACFLIRIMKRSSIRNQRYGWRWSSRNCLRNVPFHNGRQKINSQTINFLSSRNPITIFKSHPGTPISRPA